MKKITVIVEKADEGYLGRIHYEDNLIVDETNSLDMLDRNMKKLLKKFHGVDPSKVIFEFLYDLSALFEQFDYLKISSVAKRAGLNPSLVRNYVNGHKFASDNQAKKIEDTIHQLGKELLAVKVYGKEVN